MLFALRRKPGSSMSFDFDLFVIGAGSGGVRAARVAAGFGARVAIAESRELGGTCVNLGCVPKKMFVSGASYAADFAHAQSYGWAVGTPGFDRLGGRRGGKECVSTGSTRWSPGHYKKKKHHIKEK